MASYAFTDGYVYMGTGTTHAGREVGQFARSLSLAMTATLVDSTTIQDSAMVRIGGLSDVSLSGELIGDNAQVPDGVTFSNLGRVSAVALCPNSNAAGSSAYGFSRLNTSYGHGGSVGDLFVLPFGAEGATRAFRGISLGSVTDTASGNSTATQHVATAGDDTDKLYATLHVVTMTATSLDVKIQSDNAEGFSSPTDRITFTQATATASQFASESTDPTGGADDWYRANYTVSGAGTVTFIVTLGIRST